MQIVTDMDLATKEADRHIGRLKMGINKQHAFIRLAKYISTSLQNGWSII